jgi:hypothetical protein
MIKKKLVKKAKSKIPPTNGKGNGYDAFKTFGGRQYTGMKIGRSHKWYYDKGEWKEKKITPDMWEIFYSVTKRRAGKAPKGSGAPVGTGYHWYIMAHQNVLKLNANDYSTTLSGLKYKVSHKRATSEKWSGSPAAQRKSMIKFLKEMIASLEMEPVPFNFEHKGVKYKGEGTPIPNTCRDGSCLELDLILNGTHIGILHRLTNSWRIEGIKDEALVKKIGDIVSGWYE